MFEKLKVEMIFRKWLFRPDIRKAYKKVPPSDSWYDTINKVHQSLDEIRRLPHENRVIRSHDDLRLEAIWYPAEGGSDKTVICVHGYTSHAEREWAFPGLFYHSMGYNVLIPYQRAHGLSQGRYISLGALEHRDTMRWVDHVNEMIPEGSILIHGLSMGGGIVLDLATNEMPNVKCLISDAPSLEIDGMFKWICYELHKDKSGKLYAEAVKRFRKEFGVDAADFDRRSNMANGRYPLLLSAGSMENMDEALALLKQRNPKETEILILPGCNHGNGMYKQTEMYQSAIKAFLDRHMNGR